MMLDWLTIAFLEYPISANLALILGCFILLGKSSDYVLSGITQYAKKLGVSDYLIGFLIIGIGTSLPEFLSSLSGLQLGEPLIVFGTILGSGITTVTIVLGTISIIGGRINLKDRLLSRTRFLILPLCVLPLALAYDGVLSRIDGILLVLAFLGFVSFVWTKEGSFGRMKKDVPLTTLYRDAGLFLLSLGVLLITARFLVKSSILFSHYIGIPPYLMALTVIAIGASVGDLAVDLRSVLLRHRILAIGSILGGLVFENTLIYGILAIITPIPVHFIQLLPAAFFFLMPLAGVMLLVKRGSMDRRHGLWLWGCYLTFLIVQIIIMK